MIGRVKIKNLNSRIQCRIFMKEEAEEIRVRYKYRKLIQSGKIKLSHRSATLIIGPDCAYHLYSMNTGK
ncbi:MAG: hypothetical protein AMS27_01720 [Bacteroides sp. SM23_62_1]|nr:MAG: hypothetical protein AMS27_01720 [Bacteroides sp. SM23_62_1]